MYAADLGTTVGEIRLTHHLPAHGVSADAPILTLRGPVRAETIAPGDRIITRNGARIVRAVEVAVLDAAEVVTFAPSSPDDGTTALHLPRAQPVYLRGERAMDLTQKPQATVEAAHLIDGATVRAQDLGALRLITLQFDSPEVIYAGGLELGCPAVAA